MSKRIFEFKFSKVSTTHGIYYSLEPGVTVFSNIFWIVAVIVLFAFSLYLTITAYVQWKEDPILTTVSTTGYPVNKLEFPAITICGQGTIRDTVDMALAEQILAYYMVGAKSNFRFPLNTPSMNRRRRT